MGELDCDKGCKRYGFACNVNFKTHDTTHVFNRAGVICNNNTNHNNYNNNSEAMWSRRYHPLFRPSSHDKNVGACVGYKQLPQQIQCSLVNITDDEIGNMAHSQRLCDCVDYSKCLEFLT